MIVNNSSQRKATPVSYELSLFEILSGVAHYTVRSWDTLGLYYNDVYHFPHNKKIQNKMRAFNAFYFLDKMRAFLRILLLKWTHAPTLFDTVATFIWLSVFRKVRIWLSSGASRKRFHCCKKADELIVWITPFLILRKLSAYHWSYWLPNRFADFWRNRLAAANWCGPTVCPA